MSFMRSLIEPSGCNDVDSELQNLIIKKEEKRGERRFMNRIFILFDCSRSDFRNDTHV